MLDPPAARGTSCMSRCSASRISSARSSTGASSKPAFRALFRGSARTSWGLEVNDYAAEIARVTIWIGEIQWMLGNGYAYRTDPILQKLDNITCCDALMERGAGEQREGTRMAGGGGDRGQPAVPRGQAASDGARRRGRRHPVLGVRRTGSRGSGSRHLLVREVAQQRRARAHEACRVAVDPRHPWRREPSGSRTHQGDGRHLRRFVRPTVGARRSGRARLVRRFRRRHREVAPARRATRGGDPRRLVQRRGPSAAGG